MTAHPKGNLLALTITSLVMVGAIVTASESPVTLTVHADQPGAKISPTLYGIFFEDINFGADGGLSAESVKNGSFEFPDGMMGWKTAQVGGAKGSVRVSDEQPFPRKGTHYVRVELDATEAGGSVCLVNEGFRGMGVKKGETYMFAALARKCSAEPIDLSFELLGADGQVLAREGLAMDTPRGERIGIVRLLRPSRTEEKARLRIRIWGKGTLEFDDISLVPAKTWKNRTDGLRADLVQMLADLKPGFMRFPGGCIVEGHELATRYQWKNTIGPISERKLQKNRWNDEFKHRPTPDYFQSYRLGFFEFFQLCEDMGAAPLPILNCGMACQFNTGELAPADQLDAYVQDALDLIEFANGPTSSEWGEKRAKLGHPEPFQLTMLGIGNEQWGPAYFERYERFAKAIKAKYPDIRLIASAGPSPSDEHFKQAWDFFRGAKADIIDEHCYNDPAWFYNSARRFDEYDRKGPKVFFGEYAAQSVNTGSPQNRSTWECALAEAAFMTGLERNADVVVMSSYAPLLAHKDAWQWVPDLIWFDNLNVYGTCSYYVQQLFSTNHGDVVLPVSTTGADGKLFVTASREEASKTIIVKVVNRSAETVESAIDLKGLSRSGTTATAIVLKADSPSAENTFEKPRNITPVSSEIRAIGDHFKFTSPAYSVTVLRIPMSKK